MSKKNLARTAIEGGRAKFNREAEKLDNRAQRRAGRQYCDIAKDDPLADEPTEVTTKGNEHRGVKRREFADKLAPIKRWLAKQLGRPWNKVKADIRAKFPANSLAGRHILEHINGYVSNKPEDNPYQYLGKWFTGNFKYRRGEFYVNDAGILCRQK